MFSRYRLNRRCNCDDLRTSRMEMKFFKTEKTRSIFLFYELKEEKNWNEKLSMVHVVPSTMFFSLLSIKQCTDGNQVEFHFEGIQVISSMFHWIGFHDLPRKARRIDGAFMRKEISCLETELSPRMNRSDDHWIYKYARGVPWTRVESIRFSMIRNKKKKKKITFKITILITS